MNHLEENPSLSKKIKDVAFATADKATNITLLLSLFLLIQYGVKYYQESGENEEDIIAFLDKQVSGNTKLRISSVDNLDSIALAPEWLNDSTSIFPTNTPGEINVSNSSNEQFLQINIQRSNQNLEELPYSLERSLYPLYLSVDVDGKELFIYRDAGFGQLYLYDEELDQVWQITHYPHAVREVSSEGNDISGFVFSLNNVYANLNQLVFRHDLESNQVFTTQIPADQRPMDHWPLRNNFFIVKTNEGTLQRNYYLVDMNSSGNELIEIEAPIENTYISKIATHREKVAIKLVDMNLASSIIILTDIDNLTDGVINDYQTVAELSHGSGDLTFSDDGSKIIALPPFYDDVTHSSKIHIINVSSGEITVENSDMAKDYQATQLEFKESEFIPNPELLIGSLALLIGSGVIKRKFNQSNQ